MPSVIAVILPRIGFALTIFLFIPVLATANQCNTYTHMDDAVGGSIGMPPPPVVTCAESKLCTSISCEPYTEPIRGCIEMPTEANPNITSEKANTICQFYGGKYVDDSQDPMNWNDDVSQIEMPDDDDAQSFEEEDGKQEQIEARNRLEAFCFQLKSVLDEYADRLQALDKVVQDARTEVNLRLDWLEGKPLMTKKYFEFELRWFKFIYARIMARVHQSQGGGGAGLRCFVHSYETLSDQYPDVDCAEGQICMTTACLPQKTIYTRKTLFHRGCTEKPTTANPNITIENAITVCQFYESKYVGSYTCASDECNEKGYQHPMNWNGDLSPFEMPDDAQRFMQPERVKARDRLKAYCSKMKKSLHKYGHRMHASDKEEARTLVDHTLNWLEGNQLAKKRVFEDQLREAKRVFSRFMAKLHKPQGGRSAKGGSGDGGQLQQGAGSGDDGANSGSREEGVIY